MAGIGFELKKLFKDSGIFATLKAYLYSIFVTIGPIIISVIAITFMQLILRYIGVEHSKMELLQATILYSFIFSVVLVSGYCMMLSRYLSDSLYMEKKQEILPTLYGSLATMLVIAGIIGFIFYYRSPLNKVYKLFAYLLFVELVIEMVLAVYVSAIKNFKWVAYSFLFGTVLAIISGHFLIRYVGMDEILSVLIAFDICIFVVIIMLTYEIQQYFSEKSTLYFNFIKYFTKHSLIFFTNLFYTLGLYVHNFVFWGFSEINQIVENTYIYAPLYDIPSFYAFLSIIPTMVIFVVKVETAFFEKYREFFYLINNSASYEDIKIAKNDMKKVMFKELIYIMEIQLFFSIITIILGMKFLPYIGFSSGMVGMFSILVLGFYCVIIMFVIMTLLLYFDNQKSACLVAAHFFGTSFLMTLITIKLGEPFYGFGYFISGLVSLIISLRLLVKYLNNIEYHIFCIQVSWKERNGGILARVIDKINKIGADFNEKR